MIEWPFLNHSPRTLVCMVRELVASLWWLKMKLLLRRFNQELKELQDQCILTHQFMELESLILFWATQNWLKAGIKIWKLCREELRKWDQVLWLVWRVQEVYMIGAILPVKLVCLPTLDCQLNRLIDWRTNTIFIWLLMAEFLSVVSTPVTSNSLLMHSTRSPKINHCDEGGYYRKNWE